MKLDTDTGLLDQARLLRSPNCDERRFHDEPEVIIVHCISLPPGEYGTDCVERFFTNQLQASEHPYFQEMAHFKVSSHFYIQRDGQLTQFVSTKQRAWHAGESSCLGKANVNDFSIGIELEGLDTNTEGFSHPQYTVLKQLIQTLRYCYPKIHHNNIFAHSDIAPNRKPDPGRFFNWARVLSPNG
jgi:AmpD protein